VKVAVAFDHRGVHLRDTVLAALEAHDVVDLGTDTDEVRIDYPDKAREVGEAIRDGRAERAVLVCGSGVGVNIVANKVDGVRAVNAHDVGEVSMARKHNDVNVLTLSGRRLDAEVADAIVETFLETDFEGGRHEQRVALIADVEKR
jgi:ribose 5-phosphate isomerase B